MLAPATRAFVYFSVRVARNRAVFVLRSLRKPRYIIGTLLILGYAALIFTQFDLATPIFLIAIYLLQVIVVWAFMPFRRNLNVVRLLAFKQSEVQQLFAAPLSRQRLLQFKWIQMQWGTLVGALIFALLVHGIEGTSMWFMIPGLMVAGNVVEMHSAAVNISVQYLRAIGKGFVVWLLWVAALTLLIGVLLLAGAQSLVDQGDVLGWYASPAMLALEAPMYGLLAPALAGSAPEFVLALWLPMLLLVLHAFIVFAARLSFQDQAIVVAEKLEDFKKFGFSSLRKQETFVVPKAERSRLQRLAPTGPQWRALVWKNLLSIGRLAPGSGRRLVVYGILFFVVPGFLPEPWRSIAVTAVAALLAYSMLLAPSLVRVDLRIDIPHFDMIKAMPINGRQLLFGEVFGSHIIVFGVQYLAMVVLALLFRASDDMPLTWDIRLIGLAAGLPLLFGFTFFLFTLENLMALYLPAYTRLGRKMQGGMDQIGQNIIGALIRMLTLLLALIPAALVAATAGALLYFGFGIAVGAVAIGAAAAGGAMLFLESLGLIYAADGRYLRFDISAEKVAEDE